MGDVINLADIKKMQKALDDAVIAHPSEEQGPRILVYQDIHGMPQTLTEGECITQQQLDNLPDEILNLIRTEEQ